jgi:hypothetical protein
LLTFLLATQKKSELPPGNPRLAGTPQEAETCDGFTSFPGGKHTTKATDEKKAARKLPLI